jgi:hypothetical protein
LLQLLRAVLLDEAQLGQHGVLDPEQVVDAVLELAAADAVLESML